MLLVALGSLPSVATGFVRDGREVFDGFMVQKLRMLKACLKPRVPTLRGSRGSHALRNTEACGAGSHLAVFLVAHCPS